jgi:hypothetical protein
MLLVRCPHKNGGIAFYRCQAHRYLHGLQKGRQGGTVGVGFSRAVSAIYYIFETGYCCVGGGCHRLFYRLILFFLFHGGTF